MSTRSMLIARAVLVVFVCVVPITAEKASSLIESVKRSDIGAVQALIANGVDVNAPQPDHATALHWAAIRDNAAIAKLLIDQHADVNAANDFGVTPLSLACTNGSQVMIKLLLDAGASPNKALPTGETPLMTAAHTGHVNAISTLLATNVDVNATEPVKGQTALMWAAAEAHIDAVRVLLAHGAMVRARSLAGYAPLLFAARTGSRELADLLLASGADINDTAADGTSALLIATVMGNISLANFLIERGADVNADAGYTALHWASGTWNTWLTGPAYLTEESTEWTAYGGMRGMTQVAFVQKLLDAGADPNARVRKTQPRFAGSNEGPPETKGATPFLLAAGAESVAVMRVLIEYGADAGTAAEDGTTSLMMAAGFGFVPSVSRFTESEALDAVKFVIAQGGADVNAANSSGITAMHAAAMFGASTIVQYLGDLGANVNAPNKNGERPLDWASGRVRLNNANIVQQRAVDVLVKFGAVPGEFEPEGDREANGKIVRKPSNKE